MTHQNTPDQPSSSECSLDAFLKFLDAHPCTQAPSLEEPYSLYNSTLTDSTTPKPVAINDIPSQDVEYPELSFSATDTPHERIQMLTPEAVDQLHQLSPTNLGWHNTVTPHYTNPLFQGHPGPSHRLSAFPNPHILPAPYSQQQRQPLPGGLLHNVIALSTSSQLTSPSSLLPEPRPLPRVAANSKRRHPLLADNFRELGQAKERDLLIQVLHSEWLEANEEEPQNMGRSILMGFLHRPNPQSSLRCGFDGCTRSFDRQDRAVAHIRQLHLNFKPYACDRACGKRACNDRFSSWAYLSSHVNKNKAGCSKCGKEFTRKNLSRHTISCGKKK